MSSTRNLDQLNAIANACNANCDGLDSNGEILDNLAMLAEAGQLSGDGTIVVDSALDETSVAPVQNRVIAKLIPVEANSGNRLADKAYVDTGLAGKADADHTHDNSALETAIDNKVDKIEGKGLSTNDFTNEEKTRLASLHNYDDTDLQNEVAGINAVIPAEASSENKLADKKFVEDNVETIPVIKNFFKTNTTRMIAHRGMSAIAPECTLPAYELAADYGYWGGEVDIQKTKDDIFVCIHDETIDATTNGTGKVSDYTLEELKEFIIKKDSPFMGNCEANGGFIYDYEAAVRIPTFEEYLEACKKFNIVPVVELKEETLTADDMASLLDITDKWEMTDQIMFIGFNGVGRNLLEAIHSLNPMAHCQKVTLDFTIADIDYVAENFSPNCGIDPLYTKVTKELVDYAHSKGVEVNCWTCDDEAIKETLISYGVDYITTNKLLNTNLVEMKTGGLNYELGGFERTVDALQKSFELQSELTPNIMYCQNPVVGGHNLWDPQNAEQAKNGTTPYKRAILTTHSALNDDTNYNLYRAIDKTKYYINEKTIYLGGLDFTKYKMTLIPFNEKGLFLADLGWFTAPCCVSLPDKTCFVLFYFARNSTQLEEITDEDLEEFKKCYISKTPSRRYLKLDNNFVFVSNLNFVNSAQLSEMTSGYISDEPTMRALCLKGINVKGYSKIKAHYLNNDYSVTAFVYKKSSDSDNKFVWAQDLGWLEDDTEKTLMSGVERMYFFLKRKDDAVMTIKDLLNISNNVMVEIY